MAKEWKTTSMVQHFNQMRPQHQEPAHPQICRPCVCPNFNEAIGGQEAHKCRPERAKTIKISGNGGIRAETRTRT